MFLFALLHTDFPVCGSFLQQEASHITGGYGSHHLSFLICLSSANVCLHGYYYPSSMPFYSECSVSSSISITWKLVGKTESEAPPQTCWMRIWILMRYQMTCLFSKMWEVHTCLTKKCSCGFYIYELSTDNLLKVYMKNISEYMHIPAEV